MRKITVLLFLMFLTDIILGGMFAAGWQVFRWSIEVEIVVFDTEIFFAVLLILTLFVMVFQVMTYEVKD